MVVRPIVERLLLRLFPEAVDQVQRADPRRGQAIGALHDRLILVGVGQARDILRHPEACRGHQGQIHRLCHRLGKGIESRHVPPDHRLVIRCRALVQAPALPAVDLLRHLEVLPPIRLGAEIQKEVPARELIRGPVLRLTAEAPAQDLAELRPRRLGEIALFPRGKALLRREEVERAHHQQKAAEEQAQDSIFCCLSHSPALRSGNR